MKVITVFVTISINCYVLNYDSMIGIRVLSCSVVIRTRFKEYNLSCFWGINCWSSKESERLGRKLLPWDKKKMIKICYIF